MKKIYMVPVMFLIEADSAISAETEIESQLEIIRKQTAAHFNLKTSRRQTVTENLPAWAYENRKAVRS